MSAGRLVRKVLGTYVGLLACVACLTILFLSARAVMEIGGACGSGGPYEIAHPCPEGVAWMLPVSIFAGVASLGVYIGFNAGLPGPKWWALAWPALFLSLGWNFWEYGLDPPEGFGGGVSVGWIICGVVFVLMGGAPLLSLLNEDMRREFLWADVDGRETRSTIRDVATAVKPTVRAARAAAAQRPPAPTRTTSVWASATTAPPAAATNTSTDDLAEDLERLAAMHRAGDLSDSEYRAAKARRIAGGEA